MKVCKNCGNQIEDNKFFCTKCGVKVDGALNPFSSQTTEIKTEEATKAAPAKKKSKKGLVIGIAAVVVALGAGAAFGFPYLKGMFGKKSIIANMSPSERFADAINKRVKTKTDNMINAYGDITDLSKPDRTVDMDISVETNEEFDQFILMFAGNEAPYLKDALDWIDSAGIKYSVGSKDSLMKAAADISVNDKDLLEYAVTADDNDKKMYIELPGISDTAVETELTDELSKSLMPFRSSGNIKAVCSLMTGYTETATAEIKNVSESKETLDTGSFKKEYTALTAVIDTDTAQNVSRALLTKLRSDEDAKKLLFSSLYASGYGDDFINSGIDDLIEEIPSISIDNALKITLYVDDNDEIMGFKVFNDKFSVQYDDIVDGGKFYSALYVSAPELGQSDLRVMTGEGSVTDGKRTGSYSVEFSGMQLLDITVEGLDDVSGKMTIEPTKTAASLASMYLDMDISGLKLESTKNASASSVDSEFIYSDSGRTVFALAAKINAKDGADIDIPSKVISEKDGFESWASTIDYASLLRRLKESGMPVSLQQMIIPAQLAAGTEHTGAGASLPPEVISELKVKLEAKGISTEDIDFDNLDPETVRELLEENNIDVDELKEQLGS